MSQLTKSEFKDNTKRDQILDTIYKIIDEFKSEMVMITKPFRQWEFEKIDCIQQKNQFDCGVFTIFNLLQIFRGFNFDQKLSNLNSDRMRYKIWDMLMGKNLFLSLK